MLINNIWKIKQNSSSSILFWFYRCIGRYVDVTTVRDDRISWAQLSRFDALRCDIRATI